ncbi:primosomal replication protein PriB/PriC domain protein [Stenotrophomonas pavanii]|uniref:primosomal replication protein PriB/PriC domain protein n=1 Tax=Stenotrophomonas pavanii TaxID=487698 RepID=UPI00404711BE
MSTPAQIMLQTYLAAEAAVLQGQSFRMGERQLNRADLAEIRLGRREWEAKVNAQARGGSRMSVALADFRGGE